MSKLKVEALAHYDRLAACRNWGDFREEGYDGESCALCDEYASGYGEEDDCMGCPVSIKTGHGNCHGSPWHAMDDAIKNQSRSAMPLIEPLPEVLAMKEFLESLDWEGQP